MKVSLEVAAHGFIELETTSEEYCAMRAQLAANGAINLDNFASEHSLEIVEQELNDFLRFTATSVTSAKRPWHTVAAKRGKFVKTRSLL
jgi:hypothetical protein